MTMVAIALWAALTASQPPTMEVTASLHGYNFMWPSTRCCGFDFHLGSDGRASVEADISTGRAPAKYVHRFTLTPAQVNSMRRAIESAGFFEMPEQICCGSIDGDRRSLTVTIGERTHRVVFEDQAAPEYTDKLHRMEALWSVIASNIAIPDANVK